MQQDYSKFIKAYPVTKDYDDRLCSIKFIIPVTKIVKNTVKFDGDSGKTIKIEEEEIIYPLSVKLTYNSNFIDKKFLKDFYTYFERDVVAFELHRGEKKEQLKFTIGFLDDEREFIGKRGYAINNYIDPKKPWVSFGTFYNPLSSSNFFINNLTMVMFIRGLLQVYSKEDARYYYKIAKQCLENIKNRSFTDVFSLQLSILLEVILKIFNKS